jgi:hypothetical protein
MPAIPNLKPDLDFEGGLIGSFRRLTGRVKIIVYAKAAGDEAGLNLLRSAHSQIDSLEARAKSAASRDLLVTYNENWRVYQNSEGKVFEEPVLTQRSFTNKLKLNTLEVSDATTFSLWFDTADIFSGHSILVTFRDGIEGDCDTMLWG